MYMYHRQTKLSAACGNIVTSSPRISNTPQATPRHRNIVFPFLLLLFYLFFLVLFGFEEAEEPALVDDASASASSLLFSSQSAPAAPAALHRAGHVAGRRGRTRWPSASRTRRPAGHRAPGPLALHGERLLEEVGEVSAIRCLPCRASQQRHGQRRLPGRRRLRAPWGGVRHVIRLPPQPRILKDSWPHSSPGRLVSLWG